LIHQKLRKKKEGLAMLMIFFRAKMLDYLAVYKNQKIIGMYFL